MQRAGTDLRSLAETVLDTTGVFAKLVLAMLGVAAKRDAQKAIGEVAFAVDCDVLRRKNHIGIIPVPQFSIMQAFKPWIPRVKIKELWQFWHAHNDAVNVWSPE